MRIAILSDIHANRPALDAVLKDSVDQGVDRFWSLGDVIGYGPQPVEALLFLQERVTPEGWVMGNHDAMLADLLLPSDRDADPDKKKTGPLRVVTQKGEGIEVSARGQFLDVETWELTNSAPVEVIALNRAALARNPQADRFWREQFVPARIDSRLVHQDGIDHVLVHGSRERPLSRLIYPWHTGFHLLHEFKFLQKQSQERNFACVQWFGHTHVPAFVQARPSQSGDGFEVATERVWPQQTFPLDQRLVIANPGSVGQPRNLDRRAQYAVLDTQARTVTFRRVAYNWRETVRDLQRSDYPESIVKRLKFASAALKETPDEWLAYYQEAAQR